MLGIFSSEASPRRKKSLRGWILIAWLSVWTRRTAAQEVVTAAAGGTAALTAPSVTADVKLISWFRGTRVDERQLIIRYFVSSPERVTGSQSTGREIVSQDGTLIIRDLRTSDTGSYTVELQPNTGAITTAPRQLRVLGTDPTPTVSPCPTPRSCWQTTLGVACGVLLCAAIIVAGMAVHYERRLKQKGTNKEVNVHQNPSIIRNSDAQHENMRNGCEGQSANQGPAAVPAYMDLQHGDRAIYEQIISP